MKALTLIQPWAWAITHSDKRVENRTWAPPPALLGQRFAIHAGKARVDGAGAHGLFRAGLNPPEMMVRGAVVATARLVAIMHANNRLEVAAGVDAKRALALFDARRQLWWIGPIGWVLDEVRTLGAPVACRGAQGLWTLPREAELAVATQERRAA